MAARPIEITPRLIFALHQATSVPLLKCREFLREISALHLERLATALETQTGALHDPIEDDPEHAPVIDEVRKRAKAMVEAANEEKRKDLENSGLSCLVYNLKWGQGRRIWGIMQARLKEDHSIDWFTPIQMNVSGAFIE